MDPKLIELKMNTISLRTSTSCGSCKMHSVGCRVISVMFLPQMKDIGEIQMNSFYRITSYALQNIQVKNHRNGLGNVHLKGS